MSIRLEQSQGHILQSEVDFFVKGSVSLEKALRICPAKWLSSQVTLTKYITVIT